MDNVHDHAWTYGGQAEGVNLIECRRCGWVSNMRALDPDAVREWAEIPTCDEALVRGVLEA